MKANKAPKLFLLQIRPNLSKVCIEGFSREDPTLEREEGCRATADDVKDRGGGNGCT